MNADPSSSGDCSRETLTGEVLAERLTQWAFDAGFDRAGIAELRESSHGDAFRQWLARGDHAAMAWLERRVEQRLDPRRHRPTMKSAVCVALDYWPRPGETMPNGDLWTGVARYAHGEDYHRVMERRLERLEERIRRAVPGVETWRYVDTGPILERELAARAGIGWVGKHTNLLSREGSWFLLGEVLISEEVPQSSSIEDLCGRCTLCLDACPTGALPDAYRLDARLCISYWTIEHRGALPDAVRPMLGGWVFGCDICQEVCPYNRGVEKRDRQEAGSNEPDSRQPPEHRAALYLDSRRRDLSLIDLLGMERDDYVEAFRHSPMKRAKLSGLKRNAAVAMGNSGKLDYAGALIRCLQTDGDPVVRGHCAWALAELVIGGDTRASSSAEPLADALAGALESESAPEARQEIEAALERLCGARDRHEAGS